MKLILITGTRRDTRTGHAWDYLTLHKPDIVVVGDATGIDEEARRWCRFNGVHRFRCDALWEHYRNKPGGVHQAGPRRNAAMAWLVGCVVRGCSPDDEIWCAAFPDPDSSGTIDCINQALANRIRVDSR